MTRPAGSVSAPSFAGLRADPNMRFPAFPKLIDDLRIFRMPDGLGLQLHFGDLPVVLRGQLAEQAFTFLETHLDGTRDVSQVAASVPAELPVATVARTLWLLHTKGLLVNAQADENSTPNWRDVGPVLDRQMMFWGRHLGETRAADSSRVVQHRLGHATVVVVGTGMFGAATGDLLGRSGCGQLKMLVWDDSDAPLSEPEGSFIGGLRSSPVAPIAWASAGPSTLNVAASVLQDWMVDADLVVTATRNAPDQLFETINRISQRAGTPWLRGNFEASSLELGPYVLPGSSACLACLQLRRRSADPLAIEHQLDHADRANGQEDKGIVPIGETLFGATLGASHLTGEAIRVITGISMPALLNRVTTIAPLTGREQSNIVLRVPRCPECSRAVVTLAERSHA